MTSCTVQGILVARILEWLAIPSFKHYVLSELSSVTCLSWVALHSMARSFIELCKPLLHDRGMIHEGG